MVIELYYSARTAFDGSDLPVQQGVESPYQSMHGAESVNRDQPSPANARAVQGPRYEEIPLKNAAENPSNTENQQAVAKANKPRKEENQIVYMAWLTDKKPSGTSSKQEDEYSNLTQIEVEQRNSFNAQFIESQRAYMKKLEESRRQNLKPKDNDRKQPQVAPPDPLQEQDGDPVNQAPGQAAEVDDLDQDRYDHEVRAEYYQFHDIPEYMIISN